VHVLSAFRFWLKS